METPGCLCGLAAVVHAPASPVCGSGKPRLSGWPVSEQPHEELVCLACSALEFRQSSPVLRPALVTGVPGAIVAGVGLPVAVVPARCARSLAVSRRAGPHRVARGCLPLPRFPPAARRPSWASLVGVGRLLRARAALWSSRGPLAGRVGAAGAVSPAALSRLGVTHSCSRLSCPFFAAAARRRVAGRPPVPAVPLFCPRPCRFAPSRRLPLSRSPSSCAAWPFVVRRVLARRRSRFVSRFSPPSRRRASPSVSPVRRVGPLPCCGLSAFRPPSAPSSCARRPARARLVCSSLPCAFCAFPSFSPRPRVRLAASLSLPAPRRLSLPRSSPAVRCLSSVCVSLFAFSCLPPLSRVLCLRLGSPVSSRLARFLSLFPSLFSLFFSSFSSLSFFPLFSPLFSLFSFFFFSSSFSFLFSFFSFFSLSLSLFFFSFLFPFFFFPFFPFLLSFLSSLFFSLLFSFFLFSSPLFLFSSSLLSFLSLFSLSLSLSLFFLSFSSLLPLLSSLSLSLSFFSLSLSSFFCPSLPLFFSPSSLSSPSPPFLLPSPFSPPPSPARLFSSLSLSLPLSRSAPALRSLLSSVFSALLPPSRFVRAPPSCARSPLRSLSSLLFSPSFSLLLPRSRSLSSCSLSSPFFFSSLSSSSPLSLSFAPPSSLFCPFPPLRRPAASLLPSAPAPFSPFLLPLFSLFSSSLGSWARTGSPAACALLFLLSLVARRPVPLRFSALSPLLSSAPPLSSPLLPSPLRALSLPPSLLSSSSPPSSSLSCLPSRAFSLPSLSPLFPPLSPLLFSVASLPPLFSSPSSAFSSLPSSPSPSPSPSPSLSSPSLLPLHSPLFFSLLSLFFSLSLFSLLRLRAHHHAPRSYARACRFPLTPHLGHCATVDTCCARLVLVQTRSVLSSFWRASSTRDPRQYIASSRQRVHQPSRGTSAAAAALATRCPSASHRRRLLAAPLHSPTRSLHPHATSPSTHFARRRYPRRTLLLPALPPSRAPSSLHLHPSPAHALHRAPAFLFSLAPSPLPFFLLPRSAPALYLHTCPLPAHSSRCIASPTAVSSRSAPRAAAAPLPLPASLTSLPSACASLLSFYISL